MQNTMPDSKINQQLKQVAGLFRSGDGARAMKRLTELSSAHPDNVDVLRMQGISLAQTGQFEAAENSLARAAELQPTSAMAASDHASVLLSLNRFDAALSVLRATRQFLDAVPSARDRATFWFNLGRAYKQTGQAGEAEQPLLNTLEIQPQHYGALISLGDVYKALGKAQDAAGCFRRAIAANPADGTGWWSLSNLKADGFSDAEFEQLKHWQGVGQKPLQQQMMFEFAMASASDQHGLIDQAFGHYQAGNQLARQREPWDPKQFSRWLKLLQNSVDQTHIPGRPEKAQGPRPVFIISLPRSGSTLVEQVLAAHSQVTAASELPWVPQLIAEVSARKGSGLVSWIAEQAPDEWEALGAEYLRKCSHWTQETDVFTDKLPGNLPYIGAILKMLPQALVVGVRREAMDVCWSCYRQLLMGGSEFLYDMQSLARYWKDFEAHMDFWEQRAPGRVTTVQYEKLVTNPEAETRRLLDFTGLEFEAACLSPQKAKRAVNTASALQVREAIHDRGVGHWKIYEKHLGELKAALGVA
jgi:tetratricopeptide (TPR) repeat protein